MLRCPACDAELGLAVLRSLPPRVARMVAYGNAQRVYRLDAVKP